MPNAFDRAFQADVFWMAKVGLIAQNPFAMIYLTMFQGLSFVAHPTDWSIARVLVGTPPRLGIGQPPDEPTTSDVPWGVACLALANVLLVSGQTLGFPDEAQVRAVLTRD